MADAKEPKGKTDAGATDTPAAAAGTGAQPRALGIRLAPVGDSDQPVVANYSAVDLAPGMAFIDFGFLEPSVLAALPSMAKLGGKLPERLNGKLAVRVAMGYDTLANLQQQLTRVLGDLAKAAKTRQDAAKS